MAISLGDALLRLGVDTSDLDKGLQGIKQKLSEISTAWVGVGAAIIGSMGLMVKAAAEETANINRLSIALKNVGVSYDAVKDSLEGVIAATQRKTGIADSQQRDVLGRLLLVTNDYNKALSLLPLALDLAAAGQMDASTAATYLGKAMLELEGGAEKVTFRLGQASIQLGSLEELEKRVGGAAEAAANPFTILGTEIGDLGEQIGSLLLPTIRELIGKFVDIIDKVKEWIEINPDLVIALAAGAIAISGVITAVFALKTAVILLGTTVNIYFGGILIIIGLLVTAITLIWQDWDAFTAEFVKDCGLIWNAAVSAFDGVKNAIMGAVQWVLNLWGALLNLWNLLLSFLGLGGGGGARGGGGTPYPTGYVGPEEYPPGGEFPKGYYGPPVPEFQYGGIIRSPTLAMLGEAGPEAVIPLDRQPIIQNIIHVYLDGREVGQTVLDRITQQVRLQGGF